MSSTVYRQRFDFEIGYLVKSPCRDCRCRSRFPGCIDTCQPLDQIQSRLAGSLSLTRGGGSVENCALENRGWEEK